MTPSFNLNFQTYKAVRVIPLPRGVPAGSTVGAVLATESPDRSMIIPLYHSAGCSCLIYLSVRTEDEGSGAGLVYLPNCDERLAEVGDSGAAADEGSS